MNEITKKNFAAVQQYMKRATEERNELLNKIQALQQTVAMQQEELNTFRQQFFTIYARLGGGSTSDNS